MEERGYLYDWLCSRNDYSDNLAVRTRVLLRVVMDFREVEVILETYSLEDILEENDLTEADVLYFLVKHSLVDLPEYKPL